MNLRPPKIALLSVAFALPLAGCTGTGSRATVFESPCALASLAPGATSPASAPGQPLLDVVYETEIVTPAGEHLHRPDGSAQAMTAVRVPSGLIVNYYRSGVYLFARDNSARELLAGEVSYLAVSADGGRVAWWQQTTGMRAAKLGPCGLTDVRHADAAADGYPMTWAGDLVVVGKPTEIQDAGLEHWGAWDPTRGTYIPAPHRFIHPLYGPSPDGRLLLGLTKDHKTCLATVDVPAGFVVRQWHCELGSPYGGALSPDRRWLYLHVADVEMTFGARPQVVAVYWIDLFTTPPTVSRGCASSGEAVWEGADTVLAGTDHGLIRCRAGESNGADVSWPREQLPFPPFLASRYGR
jgi:hypothetical protein